MPTPILVPLRLSTLLCLQLAWAAPLAAAQQGAGAAAGRTAAPAAPATPAPASGAATAAAPPAAGAATAAATGASSAGSRGAAAAPIQASSVTVAACRGELGPPPSSPRLARVQGVLSCPDPELHRVALTLQDRATANHLVVDRFEKCPSASGRAARFAYEIEVLPGTYDLTLAGRIYESEAATGVAVAANDVKQVDFSLVKEETKLHPSMLFLPVAFLLSIWLIRWNNIARPSRLGVVAQIGDLRGRFPEGSIFGDELHAARVELLKKYAVMDWLFWSRGQEIATWNLIHKAELALLENPSQTSLDKVNARLASVQQRLSESDKSAAKALAHRIEVELDGDSAKISDPARRQLLIEATSYLFDSGDTEFAGMTSWQNKAFWLTLVGVSLIWAVGIAEGHASLFLAGAVGGFLSRMTRELKRADVATDYGASWSTLFLSPVAGAISGWFGVALVMLMTDPTVGVLGGPLKVINWDSANVAATLAAAFVFGFSERLFDRVVAGLEQSIDKKKDEAEKATTKTSPAQRGARGAAAQASVTGLSPNPVAAGGVVAVRLANLDPAKVSAVVLKAASGEQEPLVPRVEGGQLEFTVAEDTAPGTYRVVLLTPDLAPPRLDTGKDLTVTRQ